MSKTNGQKQTSSKKNYHSAKKATQPKKKASAFKIVLFIILILIGLGAIFAALKGVLPDLLGGASLSGKLAATVNGQEITQKELDDGFQKIPVEYRMFMTKEDFLDQLVDQMILRQYAVKTGITVTDEEAEENIKSFAQDSNITQEQLIEILKNQSMEYSELVELAKDQLIIQKILDMNVTGKVNVSTEEALEYYNINLDSFINPETFTVRHILFATIISNRTEEEAKKLAGEVLSKIKPDQSNFCDLVNEYSEDKKSLESCGEYTFIIGQLPEEFENWSSKARPKEVGVVDTVYGSHILLMINKTPQEITRFMDVQDQIVASLARTQERAVYQEFISSLRNSSEIKKYNLASESEKPKEETNEEAQPVLPEEILVEEEPLEDTSYAQEQPKEEPQNIVEETNIEPEEVAKSINEQEKLLCLSEKTIILYGASWNSDTTKQKNLLGDSLSKISYVECSVQGDYKSQTEECSKEKIEAYPTWKIVGNKYMGVYTLNELFELAGC